MIYYRKSDRKIFLALLGVIAIALVVIFFAGGSNDTNELLPADTLSQKKQHRDSFHRKSYPQRTVYVRTKVIYRDTSYRRGKALPDADHDSVQSVHDTGHSCASDLEAEDDKGGHPVCNPYGGPPDVSDHRLQHPDVHHDTQQPDRRAGVRARMDEQTPCPGS